MQFQIPQFIETEDKIVGPLSLRQFLYLIAGGGVSFVAYFLLPVWLWLIITVLAVGAGAALAFIKINGRPLLRLAASAARFYWHPQKYLWHPEDPGLPKTETSLRSLGLGLSLENFISGWALKRAWHQVETGQTAVKKQPAPGKAKDRYEVFTRVSGERRAVKRVDYSD